MRETPGRFHPRPRSRYHRHFGGCESSAQRLRGSRTCPCRSRELGSPRSYIGGVGWKLQQERVSKWFSRHSTVSVHHKSSKKRAITARLVRDDPWVGVRFGNSRLREGFDYHLLVIARGALALPAVELYAKSKGRSDLLNLLSPRYFHVEFFTDAVITEVQIGFGSKEFNDLLGVSDYCHR
jgi:hypothetical protein